MGRFLVWSNHLSTSEADRYYNPAEDIENY